MRKFDVGNHARVAPPRKTVQYRYRQQVRPGRIVKIVEVRPAVNHGKAYYRIGTNHKRGVVWLRSDDLLRLDHPKLRGGPRKGAGRPKRACQGV